MEDYKMDDGEVELSDHVLLPDPGSSGSLQCSGSVDSFLDELLKNKRTCTHTHTCNPPGPDAIHTHTCYHTHTQVIASEEDDNPDNREHSRKRPAGNREAVRKYREKKKAHTAYLEEEVKKLRVLNQQLARKIQRQAILEAEVLRLRSILVDLRGKIDTELGVFPFQNQCNTTVLKEGSSLQVNNDRNENFMESWEGNCQPTIVNCQANTNNMANAERACNGDGGSLHVICLASSVTRGKDNIRKLFSTFDLTASRYVEVGNNDLVYTNKDIGHRMFEYPHRVVYM
ncbi:hypothetical protein SADUNF_Sadunf03G0157300 [Salix dunnii]|uniref:BZIP domain-containing protein n=1 Tax=Salix dunnii TaxID=1413687 RepID=A0A835N532_9ROSI|nr:hypothetical protein SADUNF_Sadunf03G0157300 [Salix dunnii]